MPRRIAAVLTADLVVLALVASGCGSKSTGGGLESGLKYVPKDAPLVIAFDTNPKGKQWKQVNALIAKFPFGGQVKQGFVTGFNQRSGGLDYERDFKPLLGNDLVVAITDVAGLREGAQTAYVIAWKVKDKKVAQRLIKKGETKVGSASGADVYRSNSGGNFTALDGSTVVSAQTEDALKAALKRADGDHMSESDFEDSLGDLPKDSLLRVTGDLEAIITASPDAATIKKVKWLNALRTFGYVVTAEKDGVSTAYNVKTDSGSLGAADLPLAEGDQAPPVVRRAGEVGFGVRNLAQTFKFGEAAAQATDPAGYAKYQRGKAKTAKQLGVDLDKDLIDQFDGNATFSIALNGDFALRADLKDPAAAEATLKKIAPRLVKLAKSRGKSLGLSTPKNGKGFYGLAQAGGKKVVFGVVGKTFVAASDASRAAQFAGQSPSVVPGAKGAVVVASDARALANAVAQQQGQGTAAQIVTGALGDVIGSTKATTGELTGKLKLEIK